MTGGDAQIDVERKLATDVHGRLENLLRGTKTEECRAEILKVYQDYIGAQALVSRALDIYIYVCVCTGAFSLSLFSTLWRYFFYRQ